MSEELTTGSILLASGTVIPNVVGMTTKSYSPGWKVVTNMTRQTLDTAITSAGWSFLFLVAAIQSRRFGFDEDNTETRAVKGLLVSIDARQLNCLEIESVKRSSFLWLSCVT